ncbi:hypothetical protein QQS21_010980 [Conoideocrella luteorostrata]|uniref:L-arabinitol 4-dehydrogenase n=1 Tax=Conoideocrella luteorostrata TaxID=1105319 RepID=A0AAJ0FNY6_9HYPO|nr:hypothetical protein QQS21_010980 [Conoideocrella luteorostrata]
MPGPTNLSCLLYGPEKAEFKETPTPKIDDPYDILIRVSYVGVCGSDVHFWTHGGISRKVSEKEPLIMGHEASGVVHEVGRAVTKVAPGDRVAVEPGVPCRRCTICKAGQYNLCRDMKFAADPPRSHGTLTRLFKIPEDFVYKIPDSLSLQEAVLVEPLSVAVHGVRLADLRPGQTVLVQGSGTVGLLTAAVAKAYGARVVVVADINETKLNFAKGFVDCVGFATDIGSMPPDEAARLKKEANLRHGVDVVLECTGVESSIQVGLYACAVGATFVQIGMGKPLHNIPLGAMIEKEVVIKTSFRYGPGDYEIALQLLASGKISVKAMISSSVPFEKATEAWEKTRKGEGIKNLIEGVKD